jgi:hypothetical protein
MPSEFSTMSRERSALAMMPSMQDAKAVDRILHCRDRREERMHHRLHHVQLHCPPTRQRHRQVEADHQEADLLTTSGITGFTLPA